LGGEAGGTDLCRSGASGLPALGGGDDGGGLVTRRAAGDVGGERAVDAIPSSVGVESAAKQESDQTSAVIATGSVVGSRGRVAGNGASPLNPMTSFDLDSANITLAYRHRTNPPNHIPASCPTISARKHGIDVLALARHRVTQRRYPESRKTQSCACRRTMVKHAPESIAAHQRSPFILSNMTLLINLELKVLIYAPGATHDRGRLS
jgi:hypothetical protein